MIYDTVYALLDCVASHYYFNLLCLLAKMDMHVKGVDTWMYM